MHCQRQTTKLVQNAAFATHPLRTETAVQSDERMVAGFKRQAQVLFCALPSKSGLKSLECEQVRASDRSE